MPEGNTMNEIKRQVLVPIKDKLSNKEGVLASHSRGKYPTPFGYSDKEYKELLEQEIDFLRRIIVAIEKNPL